MQSVHTRAVCGYLSTGSAPYTKRNPQLLRLPVLVVSGHNRAVTSARYLTPASTDNIVMMRLHRPTTAGAWHEGAVLYQAAASDVDPSDADSIKAFLAHAAKLGADGVLLGAPPVDPHTPLVRDVVKETAAFAHRIGLRVVGGVDHRVTDPDELLARVRMYEEDGLDGADLGRLAPGTPPLEAAVAIARRMASCGHCDFLVTGETSGRTLANVLESFDKDASPLLRNDVLWSSGWDTHAARSAITSAARWYDAKEATLTWSVFASADPADAEVLRLMHEPLTEVGLHRLDAALLGMLGLPGTLILRQGEEVGLLDLHRRGSLAEACARVARSVAKQDGILGLPFEIYRTALRLRRELELGTGPLNWVTLPGEPADVFSFVNRSVLVVANLGDEPIAAANQKQLVHATGMVQRSEDGIVVLPPATAAWLTLN